MMSSEEIIEYNNKVWDFFYQHQGYGAGKIQFGEFVLAESVVKTVLKEYFKSAVVDIDAY